MSYTRDTIANCVNNMNYLQQKNKSSRCLLRCKRGGLATGVWNNLAICGDYNGSLCVWLWQFRYRGNRRLYDDRHWLAGCLKKARSSNLKQPSSYVTPIHHATIRRHKLYGTTKKKNVTKLTMQYHGMSLRRFCFEQNGKTTSEHSGYIPR